MVSQNFIRAIEDIIEEKKRGGRVKQLIKKYKRLSRFFPEEKRGELAECFVSFCLGKIGEKWFRRTAKVLRGIKRRKKTVSSPMTGRFYFKPYNPKST